MVPTDMSVLPDQWVPSADQAEGFTREELGAAGGSAEPPYSGGYVTHCGWNSVLEAASAGVPIIGRPSYAEHKQIKLLMVQEMKIVLL